MISFKRIIISFERIIISFKRIIIIIVLNGNLQSAVWKNYNSFIAMLLDRRPAGRGSV